MKPACYVLLFFVGCMPISVMCSHSEKHRLPPCGHSIEKRCIEREALIQDICVGQIGNITTVVRLPQNIINKIHLESLAVVRHHDEKLIQGSEKTFNYNAANRWSLGFCIDEGLLTLRVSVKYLQEEDMFMSHFEIYNAESEEILTTTHMTWFNVSGSCPPPTKPNGDKAYDKLESLMMEVRNESKKTLDICASMKKERSIPEDDLRDDSYSKLYNLLLASVIIAFVSFICQISKIFPYIARKLTRKKVDGSSVKSGDFAQRGYSMVNPTDETEESERRRTREQRQQGTSSSRHIDSQTCTSRDQGR